MRKFDMDAEDALVYCVYEAGNARCHLAHRGRRAEDVGLEPVPQGPRQSLRQIQLYRSIITCCPPHSGHLYGFVRGMY
jgi:hypothetical protein